MGGDAGRRGSACAQERLPAEENHQRGCRALPARAEEPRREQLCHRAATAHLAHAGDGAVELLLWGVKGAQATARGPMEFSRSCQSNGPWPPRAASPGSSMHDALMLHRWQSQSADRPPAQAARTWWRPPTLPAPAAARWPPATNQGASSRTATAVIAARGPQAGLAGLNCAPRWRSTRPWG